MLPAGLLAAARITEGLLLETRVFATTLIDILKIAEGMPTIAGELKRFAAELLMAQPFIDESRIMQYYRAAQFWEQQASYIGMYAANTPIDPGLAYIIYEKQSKMDTSIRYRYQVELGVIDPISGERNVFDVWYKTSRPMSREDIFDLVTDRWYEGLYEPTIPGGKIRLHTHELESLTLLGFGQYKYGGAA